MGGWDASAWRADGCDARARVIANNRNSSFSTDDWEAAKALNVLQVAVERGFTMGRGGITPCPACGAEQRSTRNRDRRAPVGLAPGHQGWRCFQCDAGGDAIDFVSHLLCKARFRDLHTSDRARVLASLRGAQAIDHATTSITPTTTTHIVSEPKRPSEQDVRRIWTDVSHGAWWDPMSRAWLESRGLDPVKVEHYDLARCLPVDADLPRWCWTGVELEDGRKEARNWSRSGHRLVLPMFDARGRLVSITARQIDPQGVGRKALLPSGRAAKGLILANDVGQRVLQTGAMPDWMRPGDQLVTWIVEGIPDYLTAASRHGDACEDPPAVFGVGSGWWTADHAARIPDGSQVHCWMQGDEASAKYMTAVGKQLQSRCRVFLRAIPGGGHAHE